MVLISEKKNMNKTKPFITDYNIFINPSKKSILKKKFQKKNPIKNP